MSYSSDDSDSDSSIVATGESKCVSSTQDASTLALGLSGLHIFASVATSQNDGTGLNEIVTQSAFPNSSCSSSSLLPTAQNVPRVHAGRGALRPLRLLDALQQLRIRDSTVSVEPAAETKEECGRIGPAASEDVATLDTSTSSSLPLSAFFRDLLLPKWKPESNDVDLNEGALPLFRALTASGAPLHPQITTVLRDLFTAALWECFRQTHFKEEEWEAMESLLHERDIIFAMPGSELEWSRIYMLFALVLEVSSVVIVPHAHMIEALCQIAGKANISAAGCTASTGFEDAYATWEKLRKGRLQLLFVTSTFICRCSRFQTLLSQLVVANAAVLFVVHESDRCIQSSSNHNQLGSLRNLWPTIPILAFSSLPSHLTSATISSNLRLRNPIIIMSENWNFDNVIHMVIPRKQNSLQDTLERLKIALGADCYQRAPGVIYSSQKQITTKAISEFLSAGFLIVNYSKEDSDFVQRWRASNQSLLIIGEEDDDFPFSLLDNVPRFVVMTHLPSSVWSFLRFCNCVQRHGRPAMVLLHYSHTDRNFWLQRSAMQNAIHGSFLEHLSVSSELAHLEVVILNDTQCRRLALVQELQLATSASGAQCHQCGVCDVCLRAEQGNMQLDVLRLDFGPVVRRILTMFKRGTAYTRKALFTAINKNAEEKEEDDGKGDQPTSQRKRARLEANPMEYLTFPVFLRLVAKMIAEKVISEKLGVNRRGNPNQRRELRLVHDQHGNVSMSGAFEIDVLRAKRKTSKRAVTIISSS